MRASSEGSSSGGTRSDSPVPRLSKVIRRENEARRARKRASIGSSQARSTWETQPGTYTRSSVPLPTTWYAMWSSPLRAYSVFGCTSAPATETPPEQDGHSRRYAENHDPDRQLLGNRVTMPRADIEIEGSCDQPRRNEPQRRLRRGLRTSAAKARPASRKTASNTRPPPMTMIVCISIPQVNALILTACQAG